MPKPKIKAKPKKAECCPLCGNADQEALEVLRSPHATLIFCHSCDEILLVQKVTNLVSKSNFAS